MLSDDKISQLRRLMELRDERDHLQEAAKKAENEYREAEMELFEELNEGPVSRLSNIDLGEPWGKVSFRPRETYYGKIIPGMEDEALEHFEQRAMIDTITAPKFVSKRLNEIVRKVVEDGEGEMPPGVDFYARRGVTITRQK
jgi:hypothetical protein